MEAHEVVKLIAFLQQHGLEVYVDGGWAPLNGNFRALARSGCFGGRAQMLTEKFAAKHPRVSYAPA